MKSKHFCLCAFAALLCALFCLGVSAAEKKVRVGLYYSGSAVSKGLNVSSPTGFALMSDNGDGTFSQIDSTNSKILSIYISGGALFCDDEKGNPLSGKANTELSREDLLVALGEQKVQGQSIVYLMPLASDSSAAYIQINDKKYPEILELSLDSNGRIKIVNVVSLEQYIKGVLPNEVYTSWESEALKAAAVATRTYTLRSIKGKHSSLGFDLCPTTDCQVYGGVTKVADSTNKATDDTAGLVLKYNGALAETLYHAISGGITESASGAWGSDQKLYPYLSVVETPFERYDEIKNGHWKYALTKEQIYSAVKLKYPDKLKDVADITYETDGGEYIHRMTLTDSSGNTLKLKTSSAVRSLFNKYALSANFTLHETYIPSNAKSGSVTIITAEGTKTMSTDAGLVYNTADSQKTLYGVQRVWFMDGKGYGHGVGMSQYGAQHAAQLGYTYAEILNTYYPGTELCSMYD